jgi:hypothetical protein
MSVRDDPKGLAAATKAQPAAYARVDSDGCPGLVMRSNEEAAQVAIAAYFDALDTDELVEAGAKALKERDRICVGHRFLPAPRMTLAGARTEARVVLTAIGLLPTGRPER